MPNWRWFFNIFSGPVYSDSGHHIQYIIHQSNVKDLLDHSYTPMAVVIDNYPGESYFSS